MIISTIILSTSSVVLFCFGIGFGVEIMKWILNEGSERSKHYPRRAAIMLILIALWFAFLHFQLPNRE